ncbi:hypothetical protein J1605_003591 [Eschrichtius robustus]|uniref:Uncharacterized protein n=1 Tax=Eschrichtius robustus TaxID=9764 RepID=A0AB34HMY8_ESCRO|nr:hypothetical protein J1605_003591 [Eschrichtius robustus]
MLLGRRRGSAWQGIGTVPVLRSDAGSRGMGSAARASGPSDAWTGSEVCSGTPGSVSVSPGATGTPLASHFFSPAEGEMLAARKRRDPCQPSAVRKAAALPWTLITGQPGEGPPAQFSRGPAGTWGPREREGPEAHRTSGPYKVCLRLRALGRGWVPGLGSIQRRLTQAPWSNEDPPGARKSADSSCAWSTLQGSAEASEKPGYRCGLLPLIEPETLRMGTQEPGAEDTPLHLNTDTASKLRVTLQGCPLSYLNWRECDELRAS